MSLASDFEHLPVFAMPPVLSFDTSREFARPRAAERFPAEPTEPTRDMFLLRQPIHTTLAPALNNPPPASLVLTAASNGSRRQICIKCDGKRYALVETLKKHQKDLEGKEALLNGTHARRCNYVERYGDADAHVRGKIERKLARLDHTIESLQGEVRGVRDMIKEVKNDLKKFSDAEPVARTPAPRSREAENSPAHPFMREIQAALLGKLLTPMAPQTPNPVIVQNISTFPQKAAVYGFPETGPTSPGNMEQPLPEPFQAPVDMAEWERVYGPPPPYCMPDFGGAGNFNAYPEAQPAAFPAQTYPDSAFPSAPPAPAAAPEPMQEGPWGGDAYTPMLYPQIPMMVSQGREGLY
jgi:hypothetical protein